MIRTAITDDGISIQADLPLGGVAYIDSDWIAAAAAHDSIPALSAVGQMLSWQGGDGIVVDDPDVAAFEALAGVSAEIAAHLADFPPHLIEVFGRGLVAREVRRRLNVNGSEGEAVVPMAIADTTGDPNVIEAAIHRLGNIGTLILAGPSLGRPFPLDLYADVHVRGLADRHRPPLVRSASGPSGARRIHRRRPTFGPAPFCRPRRGIG